MSDSLRSHGFHATRRLLCPWNSPDKNNAVGSHFLLQGIFPAHGSNLGLLHCRQIIDHLSHQESKERRCYKSVWVQWPENQGLQCGGGHGNSLQFSFLENPHGQRSLVGYGPWGHTESDTTERLTLLVSEGRRRMPQLKKREKEFTLSLHLFCLGSQWTDDAHSHWWGPTHTGEGRPSLFNLLFQMLISPINTLTDILKNNVLLAIWAPLSPVTLRYKISHHRFYFLISSLYVL